MVYNTNSRSRYLLRIGRDRRWRWYPNPPAVRTAMPDARIELDEYIPSSLKELDIESSCLLFNMTKRVWRLEMFVSANWKSVRPRRQVYPHQAAQIQTKVSEWVAGGSTGSCDSYRYNWLLASRVIERWQFTFSSCPCPSCPCLSWPFWHPDRTNERFTQHY